MEIQVLLFCHLVVALKKKNPLLVLSQTAHLQNAPGGPQPGEKAGLRQLSSVVSISTALDTAGASLLFSRSF